MQNYTHELVVIVNKISPALISRRTFSVAVTKLWNQLPINLKKEATTAASFRKAFHIIFLSSYGEAELFSSNAS